MVPVTFMRSPAYFAKPGLSWLAILYTLSPTTMTYLAPFFTHPVVHCFAGVLPGLAPHMLSRMMPVELWSAPNNPTAPRAVCIS
jgi:hypothetical protein